MPSIRALSSLLTTIGLLSLPSTSWARHTGPDPESDPAPSADDDASGTDEAIIGMELDTDADTKRKRPRADRRKDVPWIKRWTPERNMAELGVFGGAFLPAPRLELFEADLTLGETQGFKPFTGFAGEGGGRIAYLPIRFLGIEAEGAAMFGQTEDNQSAMFWTARGHVIGQLGLWAVTPFIVAGGTALGVRSNRSAVGNDVDAGIHFGGGLKFYITRGFMARLDARDTLTAGRGVDTGVVHNIEVLAGFSLVLRPRPKAKRGPRDTDSDGILDTRDHCIDTPGVPEYNGCPIPDTDGDGILDPDDQCIDIPGIVQFKGCPIPDTDGDGIFDPDDECVDVPGIANYRGCPIPDTDGDGLLDPDDKCPKKPENFNGFEDEDGCPDILPNVAEKFSGVIEGIYFSINKAFIKSASEPTLADAAATLVQYPTIRLEISGHTDSRGKEKSNRTLSKQRADSVKRWLVKHGVAAHRIETRGAGENEPIASNKTRSGRAKNRRIEFRLLSQ